MLIEAHGISKTYFTMNRQKKVEALCKTDFYLAEGKTVGIIGESGSGKSTLGGVLSGLIKPDTGAVFYKGCPAGYPFKRNIRKRIQILFQHPEISFNPKISMHTSLKEAWVLAGKKFTEEKLLETLHPLGLGEEHLKRYPSELSGGELQRAALCRILVLEPEFIVLDEPTSMLDAITQAQIMGFLAGWQKKYKTAYLFITHDEELCNVFSDSIIYMNQGDMEERNR